MVMTQILTFDLIFLFFKNLAFIPLFMGKMVIVNLQLSLYETWTFGPIIFVFSVQVKKEKFKFDSIFRHYILHKPKYDKIHLEVWINFHFKFQRNRLQIELRVKRQRVGTNPILICMGPLSKMGQASNCNCY